MLYLEYLISGKPIIHGIGSFGDKIIPAHEKIVYHG